MSLWGVHVGFAGIVTTLALYVLAPRHPARGLVIVANGAWAVIPDVHHGLDALPELQAAWRAFHGSAAADLFWLHRTIDVAEPADNPLLSLGMWLLFATTLLVTEVRLRRRDPRTRD